MKSKKTVRENLIQINTNTAMADKDTFLLIPAHHNAV